jgi:heat shock protein HslJ
VTWLVILAAGAGLAGCKTTGDEQGVESEIGRNQRLAPALAELANATYEGILAEPITLKEGRWEGEPFEPDSASRPTVWLLGDLFTTGDLNGDKTPEAVVLLGENSGGSGTYVYVAVVGFAQGAMVNLSSDKVGDRVQIRSLALSGPNIVLEVVQAGPEDAACCPTQKASLTWSLQGNRLVQTNSAATGTISVADLAGPEWLLTHFADTEPAPAEPEITLVFEAEGVAGGSGCNRYFGGISETAPQEISFGAMGATKMMCPEPIMALENRYLQALERVKRYSFLAGKLALSYQEAEITKTLLFVRREFATQ